MTVNTHHTGLATQNLTLVRGGRVITAGVTVTLPPASITMLRGANGSGKTTLLRALAGLLEPTAGKILLATKSEILATAPQDRRQQAVFFGHANGVKGPLTVFENLRFWSKLYTSDQSRIDDALSALALQALAERRAETLSAGQRRRVGLCRVLLSGKPIWLLDEPTASMDAASIAQFQKLIDAHREAGGCILIATHDALQFDGAQTLELRQKSNTESEAA